MNAIDVRVALEATSAQVSAESLGEADGFRVFPQSVAALGRAVAVVRGLGLPLRVRGHGDAPWAPPPQGVLLDLSALDRVASLDGETGIARVEAGCSVAALESAARRVGSTLGPLLPSVRAGSVGAWLAGPTRGERGIPGARRETAALSVAAILADGKLAESRAAPRSATGPDLDHLSLGGEGKLAVIAAAWIRLVPASPAPYVCARAPSLGAALQAVRRLCADRLAPARARIASLPQGGVRVATAWDGMSTADRDRERGERSMVRQGCTAEVETADTIEFARSSATADVVEMDASWAQLAALLAGAQGADVHLAGLHAGGAFAAVALAGVDTDAAAVGAKMAGARVIAPNRLRDPGPSWSEMGAGKLWTRLCEALGTEEAKP